VDEVERLAGTGVRQRSRWLNGVSVELDPRGREAIRGLSCVLGLQPVAHLRRREAVPAVPSAGPPGGSSASRPGDHTYDYGPSFHQLDMLRVPEAHDMGITGEGVFVCCLDSGFYKEHEALQSMEIVAEYDFVFGDGDTQNSAEDDPGQHRHGTGVVAVIGAFVPGRLIGPAFGAAFLLGKTEDIRSETAVEEDNWVAGMEWADSLGAEVISSSLGYREFDGGGGYSWSELDGSTAVTTVAANRAVERGIAVAVSMGNDGPAPGTLSAPADAVRILSCGAVDSARRLADFSSRGPTGDGRLKPEVCAQGVDTYWASSSGPFNYGYADGTSLSTPLVGALCALLLQAHPDWSPLKVREALAFSAGRFRTPDNGYGHGVPDLVKALLDPRRADADGSGRVDGFDLARLALAFGSSEAGGTGAGWDPAVDLTGNGVVDGEDLALLSGYFGDIFPAGF
jgi:serine protease AprX